MNKVIKPEHLKKSRKAIIIKSYEENSEELDVNAPSSDKAISVV